MTGLEPNLLLIGLRGSGKSTIARGLAQRQRRTWIDLDDLVRAEFPECASITEIFAQRGEAAFRKGEIRVLRTLLDAHRGAIIALGGGAPTAPGADALLREATQRGAARVVYLRCQPATLRARLTLQDEGERDDRPSLTGADPLHEIEVVFDQRDSLYRDLALRTINELQSVDATIDALESWLNW